MSFQKLEREIKDLWQIFNLICGFGLILLMVLIDNVKHVEGDIALITLFFTNSVAFKSQNCFVQIFVCVFNLCILMLESHYAVDTYCIIRFYFTLFDIIYGFIVVYVLVIFIPKRRRQEDANTLDGHDIEQYDQRPPTYDEAVGEINEASTLPSYANLAQTILHPNPTSVSVGIPLQDVSSESNPTRNTNSRESTSAIVNENVTVTSNSNVTALVTDDTNNALALATKNFSVIVGPRKCNTIIKICYCGNITHEVIELADMETTEPSTSCDNHANIHIDGMNTAEGTSAKKEEKMHVDKVDTEANIKKIGEHSNEKVTNEEEKVLALSVASAEHRESEFLIIGIGNHNITGENREVEIIIEEDAEMMSDEATPATAGGINEATIADN